MEAFVTIENILQNAGELVTVKSIAQVIGIVAMIATVFSFMQRKQNTVLTLQLIGGLLFCVHYFMLGAISGGLLNIIAVIRAIVFLNKDRLKANHPAWSVGFIICYVLSYAAVFLVFGKEPTPTNIFLELLPVIAMILSLISFRYSEAKYIRRYGLASSPLWLTYNIANGSVGAIICEVMNLLSITIGILRHDIKWKKKK